MLAFSPLQVANINNLLIVHCLNTFLLRNSYGLNALLQFEPQPDS